MKTKTELFLAERQSHWIVLAGIFVLCLLGLFAALVRWHALDDWCAAQLTDEPRPDN